MRIISGTARGRKLKEPGRLGIRPTNAIVKESIFNIVQFDIEGRRVLDLFAGTGQLGIEALSRGAESAVFVDSDPAAVKLIHENLKLCGFEGPASVYTRDAIKYLRSAGEFDLIFLDPPYDSALAAAALSEIIEFDKLNINGIIICETRADATLPAVSAPRCRLKEYRYGAVKITRFDRES